MNKTCPVCKAEGGAKPAGESGMRIVFWCDRCGTVQKVHTIDEEDVLILKPKRWQENYNQGAQL